VDKASPAFGSFAYHAASGSAGRSRRFSRNRTEERVFGAFIIRSGFQAAPPSSELRAGRHDVGPVRFDKGCMSVQPITQLAKLRRKHA